MFLCRLSCTIAHPMGNSKGQAYGFTIQDPVATSVGFLLPILPYHPLRCPELPDVHVASPPRQVVREGDARRSAALPLRHGSRRLTPAIGSQDEAPRIQLAAILATSCQSSPASNALKLTNMLSGVSNRALCAPAQRRTSSPKPALAKSRCRVSGRGRVEDRPRARTCPR